MDREERKQLAREVRFVHFNVGQGHATVAGVVHNGVFHYGIAFCSPKDVWHKQTGRIKSKRRMWDHIHWNNFLGEWSKFSLGKILPESPNYCGSFPVNEPLSRRKHVLYCKNAIEEAFVRGSTPSWCKNLEQVQPRSSKKEDKNGQDTL